MKVHPVADYFPMMPEEELQGLAEDIKANGLIHPVIRDKEGQLIDGRNRLKACKMAGVEPRFEELNGQDPVAFIVSANLARRNMLRGQQAMALAMIYPEPEKGGRGKKSEAANLAETAKFSHRRLNEARAVLRHPRKLAESVIAGTKSLDVALATVEKEKKENDSDEEKLTRLRRDAPDLADQVAEERLTIKEAIGALTEREKEKAQSEEAATSLVCRAVGILTPLEGSAKKYGTEIAGKMNPEYWKGETELTAASIQTCADVLGQIAKAWKEKAGA